MSIIVHVYPKDFITLQFWKHQFCYLFQNHWQRYSYLYLFLSYFQARYEEKGCGTSTAFPQDQSRTSLESIWNDYSARLKNLSSWCKAMHAFLLLPYILDSLDLPHSIFVQFFNELLKLNKIIHGLNFIRDKEGVMQFMWLVRIIYFW